MVWEKDTRRLNGGDEEECGTTEKGMKSKEHPLVTGNCFMIVVLKVRMARVEHTPICISTIPRALLVSLVFHLLKHSASANYYCIFLCHFPLPALSPPPVSIHPASPVATARAPSAYLFVLPLIFHGLRLWLFAHKPWIELRSEDSLLHLKPRCTRVK